MKLWNEGVYPVCSDGRVVLIGDHATPADGDDVPESIVRESPEFPTRSYDADTAWPGRIAAGEIDADCVEAFVPEHPHNKKIEVPYGK